MKDTKYTCGGTRIVLVLFILWKYRLFQHHFLPPAIECLKLGQLDECMNYPSLQLVVL